jgi:hypothetical protein
MALKGKRRNTETQLVRQCLQFLSLHGIMAWRSNSGAVKGSYTNKDGTTKQRFVRFSGAKGMSDITGIIPKMRRRTEVTLEDGTPLSMFDREVSRGVLLAVECKTDKGKLRPDQKEYLLKITKAGGIALVVRSIEELESDLKEAGVL